jgi:CHASE3 domain sensor protein
MSLAVVVILVVLLLFFIDIVVSHWSFHYGRNGLRRLNSETDDRLKKMEDVLIELLKREKNK